MKKLAVALLILLFAAGAKSPDEVWEMLAAHQEVRGYSATVSQGPVVYKVYFLRPRIRIEWVEGPPYLVGNVMISDGQWIWSRGKEGGWKKTPARPPSDPAHLFFFDLEKARELYRIEEVSEEGGVLTFALVAKTPPAKSNRPARWVFTTDPKSHRPLAYRTYSKAGKLLGEVVYRELDPTPPDPALFEVKP